MVEFISRNIDAIILSTIFLFLGYALSLISSKSKNNQATQKRPITLIQITNIKTYRSTTPTDKLNTQDGNFFAILTILACCFGYIFWRQEILLTLSLISSLSIGMFIGSTVYAYNNNAIEGTGWATYLLFSCATTIFLFILIASAFSPSHAPDNFSNFQTILRQEKLTGLIKAMKEMNTLTWLITHVFGVIILFYIQVRLTLSTGYYLALININSTTQPARLIIWYISKAARYRNPIKNTMILTATCLLSYLLINGHIYLWYNQFFTTAPL